jgi:hypothetical protein
MTEASSAGLPEVAWLNESSRRSAPPSTRCLAVFVTLLALAAIACANAAPSASGTTTSGPAGAPTECPIEGFAGRLPSNRLIDATVESGAASDRVLFVFGSGVSSPAGDPMGSLARAEPPFSSASSGAIIDVAGTRFLEIRFTGMVLAGEDGKPTFAGARDREVEFPALRQLTLYDESEGVVGWYVGFDGPGCATLTVNPGGGAVQLEIAHGA